MTFRDWKLRLRALVWARQAERDLQDELSFHIAREAKKLIDQGVEPRRAHDIAQARFGSMAAAADACRDERGTAAVDNTIRDVQYALRTLRRAPLAAATIVITVSIGLGAVAALFTILNTFLFRVDAVPDITEIYAVVRPEADGSQSLLTRARFDALQRETSVFSETFAAVSGIDVRVDGQMMDAALVSGTFFPLVRVAPAMGRTLGPSDDERSGGHQVIVLSARGWERRFNRDPHVLGRRVLVGGVPFEIVGVMPAGFRGLEVGGPDFWAPLSLLALFRPAAAADEAAGVDVVGRLRPELSVKSARAQLAAWDANQQAARTDRRTAPLTLQPRRGTIPQPMEAVVVFTPLFFAFGLILLIGCANVANLLLARAVARQREIGIRLSLGASRRRIVRQLMTESWLLALAAAAGGYLVSRATLEGVVYWALRTMPVDLGDVNLGVPASDWRVAVFLIVASMAATAFFALLPALHATKIEPVRTLRGEQVKHARPGRVRNALIGIQVFASALLLICAAIFLRSAVASSRFDPGLRSADTLLIDTLNEPKREAVLAAIASDPAVAAHGAVRPGILARPFDAVAEIGESRPRVTYKFVSPEYFDVFDIPILRGRSFTAAERDGDHPVAIVSETAAQAWWPDGSAVGETFRLVPTREPGQSQENAPPIPARVVTVIGVSRHVAGFRISDVRDAGIFLPTHVHAPETLIVARVSGDPDRVRNTLMDRLTRVDPNLGLVMTLRSIVRLEGFLLRMAFWISLALGSLALLLTVSGLFSVLSYLVEQRTREIGVRMALGASAGSVTQLVLAQTTRPVLFGLLGGAGFALGLATVLLAMPTGAPIGEIVHVTDPVAYAASLLVVVAACLLAAWLPALRAARVDPMLTLRHD